MGLACEDYIIKLLNFVESWNSLDPRSNWRIRRILTDLVRY
jgi:hypothetical protein